ncbi:MAG: GMC family oxidoreductase [Marivivens sp.]|nr:GMC family oxidoreductase [Marivivens sp.]
MIDVIIIGSGAGGGAAAWRLTSKGLKVLLIESGPRFDPLVDFRQDQSNWETSFPDKPGSQGKYIVAPLQELTDDTLDIRSWNKRNGPYVTGPNRVSFGYHHVRGFGGSSLHFTGEAHRLNPKSMRMQTDHGVGADWPISADDLSPYWELAEDIIGASGPDFDPHSPRAKSYPNPPHAISYSSEVLSRGAQQIGLSVTPNSLAVNSRPYDDRPDCNYCGGCLRGCQRGDKGSIDVTYLRRAQETGNLTAMTSTEVTRLVTEGERVIGVIAFKNGRRETITASVVMLCAGAVFSPALLLNSADDRSPNGLCNESGMVGRNLMETLLTTTSALHPNQLGSHRGLPVDWIAWDYNHPNAIPDIIGGCRFGPAMAESDLVGPVAYATRVVDGWGIEHKQTMKSTFGRLLSVAAIGESLPNERTFVSLSSEINEFGNAIPLIHSHLDDMALARLRFMTETCRQIIAASGCYEPIEEFSSVDAFSSTHIFGTCRMGHDPATSVINANCRSFRWPNFYIADASVFPSTGGGESPGLTIQALAIRAADHIISEIGEL